MRTHPLSEIVQEHGSVALKRIWTEEEVARRVRQAEAVEALAAAQAAFPGGTGRLAADALASI